MVTTGCVPHLDSSMDSPASLPEKLEINQSHGQVSAAVARETANVVQKTISDSLKQYRLVSSCKIMMVLRASVRVQFSVSSSR